MIIVSTLFLLKTYSKHVKLLTNVRKKGKFVMMSDDYSAIG